MFQATPKPHVPENEEEIETKSVSKRKLLICLATGLALVALTVLYVALATPKRAMPALSEATSVESASRPTRPGSVSIPTFSAIQSRRGVVYGAVVLGVFVLSLIAFAIRLVLRSKAADAELNMDGAELNVEVTLVEPPFFQAHWPKLLTTFAVFALAASLLLFCCVKHCKMPPFGKESLRNGDGAEPPATPDSFPPSDMETLPEPRAYVTPQKKIYADIVYGWLLTKERIVFSEAEFDKTTTALRNLFNVCPAIVRLFIMAKFIVFRLEKKQSGGVTVQFLDVLQNAPAISASTVARIFPNSDGWMTILEKINLDSQERQRLEELSTDDSSEKVLAKIGSELFKYSTFERDWHSDFFSILFKTLTSADFFYFLDDNDLRTFHRAKEFKTKY